LRGEFPKWRELVSDLFSFSYNQWWFGKRLLHDMKNAHSRDNKESNLLRLKEGPNDRRNRTFANRKVSDDFIGFPRSKVAHIIGPHAAKYERGEWLVAQPG
jgi:hypothetical protein